MSDFKLYLKIFAFAVLGWAAFVSGVILMFATFNLIGYILVRFGLIVAH